VKIRVTWQSERVAGVIGTERRTDCGDELFAPVDSVQAELLHCQISQSATESLYRPSVGSEVFNNRGDQRLAERCMHCRLDNDKKIRHASEHLILFHLQINQSFDHFFCIFIHVVLHTDCPSKDQLTLL
jgi:hypothetical protein